jgi:hypothetical protein
VTNVLNIINELSGLQQDLLQAAGAGRALNTRKLEHTSERIRLQVERGQTIMRNVNRFAHGADVPVAVFDVKETISRVVFLAERWTRLRKTKLVAELPEDSIALEASPFLFGQAVFLCIDAALLAAAEEREIRVSYSVTGEGAEVVVESADPIPLSAEIEARVATLRALLEELGGKLKAGPGGGGKDRFVLLISGSGPLRSRMGSAASED